MSTPQKSLRERLQGKRQSTNIEDRRGQRVLPSDESDQYPPIYQYPPLLSEDLNDPMPTEYEMESHIPIYKARDDLDKGRHAARDWLVQEKPKPRRKRKVRF